MKRVRDVVTSGSTAGLVQLPSHSRGAKLMSRPAFFTVGFLLVLESAVHGQGKEAVLAGYTKYEYRIPMRDGVKLFTAVYVPKDDSKQYPFLMMRTPYTV